MSVEVPMYFKEKIEYQGKGCGVGDLNGCCLKRLEESEERMEENAKLYNTQGPSLAC